MSAHSCSTVTCSHAPLRGHGVRADVGRALLCECGVRTADHPDHVKSWATTAMRESMADYRETKRSPRRAMVHVHAAVHAAQVMLSVAP